MTSPTVRLFIFLPQLPYPPRSGGRIVTAPLVDGLAAKHEVHLFSLLHGFEGEEEGRRLLAERVASLSTAPGTKRLAPGPLLSAAISKNPYKVHRFWRPSLLAAAREIAKQSPPDAIHCQNFYTARYAKELEAPRKILYEENFEALLLDRWMERVTNPFLSKLIRMERKRTLEYEMESARWFDRMATISSADEQRFRAAAAEFPDTAKHFETSLRTVRPSIDSNYYNPKVLAEVPSPFPKNDERKHVVFTGSFNYLANVDGALWMAQKVTLRLPRDHYSLWLVGQRPEEAVQKLHDPPRVYVTGAVEDVRPYLFHADASIVPLRIGGGIRLKILESLALGCPLVSTPVGCEGLWSKEDPPEWRIAEEPGEFAIAIQEACAQSRRSERLRKWVVERFSPERFVSEMEGLYSST